MNSKRLHLQGMGIVVTRPVHQADGLCRLIAARGGRAIRFPTLEIRDPQDPAAALAVIDRLDDYDLAVFTSANAVSRGMELLLARRRLPPGLPLFAIGKATARALEQYGITACQIPEQGYDSEALLAMSAMQTAAGKRIVIFRGEGGRELLGDTLRTRGAQVTEAAVYRRNKPAVRPDDLLQYGARGEIQAVVVTSNESLQNLFELVGATGQSWLRDTPLVVVSERACTLALQLGFNHPPLVASEASEAAIIEALLKLPPNPIPITTGDPQ